MMFERAETEQDEIAAVDEVERDEERGVHGAAFKYGAMFVEREGRCYSDCGRSLDEIEQIVQDAEGRILYRMKGTWPFYTKEEIEARWIPVERHEGLSFIQRD